MFFFSHQDDQAVEPLTYGRIASYYYLKHPTIRMFKEQLRAELTADELLTVLTVSFTWREQDILVLLASQRFDPSV